ncbi:MAG: transporter [Cyclobacteriaceae bacterium]|nr:transporter [Cyclobacteriaceae bacterium]
MRSQIKTAFESYLFFESGTFYALQFGYNYGIGNRHLLGIAIPFYHNVFNADYGGFENTTGMGDIRMSYMAAVFNKENRAGLQRISPYLEVSAPTGEYQLGRGAGAWLYKPGIIFSIRPAPEVSFYPEIKYQFSTSEVNSQGGDDGLPDPEDPTKDLKYKNLSLALPVTLVLNDWNGWFSLNVLYTHSFEEKNDFIFIRTDIGKMIGDQTAFSLNIAKFIAGQPRLNVIVQAKFNFFLGRK